MQNDRYMKKLIFIILFLSLIFSSFNFAFVYPVGYVAAATDSFGAQNEKLEIYFFYSSICPHCVKEKEFLQELKEKYPEIEIKEYEIVYNSENQKLLSEFYQKYQVPEKEKGYVPVTFTSTKYFIGFNEQIAQEIESCIRECLIGEKPILQKIRLPIFGEIDVSKMSLPALTVIFGVLDGLNPCAMWVLIFLLTLLINTRSRKRMWLIAGTFILASGIIYFLILSAWLKLFLLISYVNLTRILIGILALGVGIWQIKNFITFHPGVCKVLGLSSRIEQKLKLKERAEKIATSPLTFGIIGGLIVLALGVNLVEFFCSSGFPAIYTRILALNTVGKLSYHLYLLLYTFVFMLDDLIIFSLAIITLSKIGFTEKYNYWATLIGGLLMLILGILLIFQPELLIFG